MKCRICDSEIDFNFSNTERLRELQLCRACEFWWEKVEWHINGDVTSTGNRVARIRNDHYVIHPDGSTMFNGFGGQKYVILFDDGTEVTTHNLWYQGEIPQRFREHLPPNAVFLDQRRTCKCRAKFFPMVETQTMCTPCVLAKKPQRW